MDLICTTKTKPGYRTDHSLIQITIKLNNFQKGKGLWKFNCNLLKNKDYLNQVNNIISSEKSKYALPVYNKDNITTLSNKYIQFTITDQQFLEMLLLEIRAETIKFSAHAKKLEREKETSLIPDIESLETGKDYQNFDLLQVKKEELQNIRNIKLKGQMIRSRVIC